MTTSSNVVEEGGQAFGAFRGSIRRAMTLVTTEPHMRTVWCLCAVLSLVLGAPSARAQQLLINGSLDHPGTPSDFATGWTLQENPEQFNPATFAAIGNHTTGPTGVGLWLRPFVGAEFGNHNERTGAQLLQTVPASPGLQYVFKGWSRWEGGYSGGVTTLDPMSPSGAAPSPTETFLLMQFLDATSNPLSTLTLDLRTQQSNDNVWRQHSTGGVAPAGTASLRLGVRALGMIPNVNLPPGGQSAYFDDFSLSIQLPKLLGDFDSDGDVDLIDYRNLSTHLHTNVLALSTDESYLRGDMTRDRRIDGRDFLRFRTAFDQANGSGAFQAALTGVPEPSAGFLILAACTGLAVRRRG